MYTVSYLAPDDTRHINSHDMTRPPKEIIAYELHGNCYLNITWRCTLRCKFCPKFNGDWTVQGYDLRLHHEPEIEDIIEAIGDPSDYQEIVFCGLGEPTMRLGVVVEVSNVLKEQGAIIRINTDGLGNLLYGHDITPQLNGLIDTVSVSMNAQNQEVYDKHCRPGMQGAYPAMLDFTRKVKTQVPRVVMTAIDGMPDVDIQACKKIAAQLGVEFRTRYLDVVG